MSRPLRIAVADDERSTRDYFLELLPRMGHQAVAVRTGRELVELCRVTEPDLVLADLRMPDLDGIEAAAEVCRTRPVPFLLVTGHHDEANLARAAAVPVMGYLTKPVKGADVQAAIALALARFGQLQSTREEAADLRQALEDRKIIERAKGVLMQRLGVEEPDAFARLRKLSSRENRKLAEVAREVVGAEAVFRPLDYGEAGNGNGRAR